MALLILVQLAVITYIFGWKRQGYHMDENWHYGFSNAYYMRQIYHDNEGNTTNFNEWRDSQVLKDYLEVQKGQQFSYDSVAYNTSVDLSPPLSNMILHTICSFFPDTFSWWYAYSINVVCFILTMIGLYFLSKEMLDSRKLALFTCAFYGFTKAAINCFIYLRMYAILTALAVWMVYLFVRLAKNKSKHIAGEILGIAVLTFLGGLTHYYFYILAFFFTGFFVLWKLFSKQWKVAVFSAVLQLAAVGISFLVWSPGSSHMQSGTSLYSDTKMAYGFDLKISIYYVIRELTAILPHFPSVYTWAVIVSVLLFAAVILIPLSVLFRNETWFKNFLKKSKNAIRQGVHAIPDKIKKSNKFLWIMILSLDATVAVISKISNMYAMSPYGDRYLFYVMPLFLVVIVYAVRWAVSLVTRRKKEWKKWRERVTVLLMTVDLILVVILAPVNYLFETYSSVSIPELVKDSYVVSVVPVPMHLVPLSSMLIDSKAFYMIETGNVMEQTEKIEEPKEKDAPVYLLLRTYLLKQSESETAGQQDDGSLQGFYLYDYTKEEILQKFQTLSWVGDCEFVDSYECVGGGFEIYRLSRK